MDFLQSPELTYRIWNLANEIVFSKIKNDQISEFDYMFAISIPCKPLLEKERHSNQVVFKSSLERVPLKSLWSALRTLSIEQLPSPGGCFDLLLLLAWSAIRFCITSHVVYVNCPVNKLLEMLSTCRGCPEVEDGSSCKSSLSWLKLRSMTRMPLEENSSSGRPPDRELQDKLRFSRPVRSPRDGEMCPSSPLEANEKPATVLFLLQ
ncbi:hypothetical protein BS78_06G025600, partial [Paspalum vaginatum]